MKQYPTWFSKIILFAVLLLALLLASLFLYYPVRNHWLIHKSAPIISRIEGYRLKHGALPGNLSDIEIGENRFFYQKRSDTNFIIWFGERLGESVTYDSNRKAWSE